MIDVAIINLLCRKSRRKRIVRLVAQLVRASRSTPRPVGTVTLVEAVDGVSQSFSELESRYGLKPFAGWQLTDDENRLPSSWRLPQTSGGIASGLSHLDVAAASLAVGSRCVLVMEDDCVLTSEAEPAYKHFLACMAEADRLVPDWDMLMLGAAGHRIDIASPTPIPGAVLIETAGFSYLTTMYLLSQRGMGKLAMARRVATENGLAFDELHNALAGLTGRVRPDVKAVFAECPKLILLSAIQSLVRQDPHDGVHDTTVIASARRNSWVIDDDVDVPPPFDEGGGVPSSHIETPAIPFELEPVTRFVVPVPVGKEVLPVVWMRRRCVNLTIEQLRDQMGVKPEKKKSKGLVEQLLEMKDARLKLNVAMTDACPDGDAFPPSFDWFETRMLTRE